MQSTDNKIIPIDLTLSETRKERNKELNTLRHFYTTDVNTAFLLFRSTLPLKNTTASLILSQQAGSVIHKVFEITEDPFLYEVPNDVVLRSGAWVCQIVIERDGEALTNKTFIFDVFPSLLDTLQPNIVDIDNYTLMFNQITNLKNDSQEFLELLKHTESERVLKDEMYKETYEAVVDKENKRVVNETVRTKNEYKRIDNEITRQQTFNQLVDLEIIKSNLESIINQKMNAFNNSSNTIIKTLNELNSEMEDYLNSVTLNEIQRVEAETMRTNLFNSIKLDETTRKTNEATRQQNEITRGQTFGTYDGRITNLESDYAVLGTNLFPYKFIEINGYASVTGIRITLLKNHFYYTKRNFEVVKGIPNTITGRVNALNHNLISIGSENSLITKFVGETATGDLFLYGTQGVDDEGNKMVNFENVFIIDLTATFGDGNEPTVSQIDRLLAQFPDSWFEGTQNIYLARWALNELRRLDSEKANKKQEEWITPTLLNGWVSNNVRYMKDELGFIHFDGDMSGGALNTIAFQLPNGYKFVGNKYYSVESYGSPTGVVYIQNGNVLIKAGVVARISLYGITFKAES